MSFEEAVIKAVTATVSIGGKSPALVSDTEHRNIELIAPSGVVRLPKVGERQLILKTMDGSYALMGLCPEDIPDGLNEGDILIKNGKASITLHSDGRVEILGRLIINGSELFGTET